jgi:hypothetical protein
MKNFFTFLGIAGILVVALTVTNVAAQSTQPIPTAVPPVVSMTPLPQLQSQQAAPAQQGWGMGMRGGMMGGRMMGGRGMMQGHMSITAGSGFNMPHETMMAGVTPMHVDFTQLLGMTTQDLYNQMASGKSLVEIAAEKGITEQQMITGMMTGRRAAFDQAVKQGYMTQMYADTMLTNMESNLKTMMNARGVGSGGWDMMWDTQSSLGFGPFGMHR